ncbi:MAG: hypothetical protein FJY67_03360 [Calditrichaeota bacterium]|nr:hypothetical protein [Calditrichota bacterium]
MIGISLKSESCQTSALVRTVLSGCVLAALAVVLRSAEASPSWHEVASMKQGRMGFAAATDGERLYVFGGAAMMPRMGLTATAEVYIPDDDAWEDLAPLPVALYQASAVRVGESILLFGGLSENGPNVVVFRYNIRRNAYDTVGRMPGARRAFGTVLVGRRVMLAGGVADRQQYPREVLWWDTANNEWEGGPALNHPSSNFGFARDGAIWIVGGIYLGLLDRVEIFREGNWHEVPAMRLPEPRGELSADVSGDTMLVVAGGAMMHNPVSAAVIGFHFGLERWIELPEMRSPRVEFSLLQAKGRLYAIGGGRFMRENRIGMSEVEVFYEPTAVSDDDAPGRSQHKLPGVFPNPAWRGSRLTVPQGTITIGIYDLSGRLIAGGVPDRTSNVWLLPESLPPGGAYLYRFETTDRRIRSGVFVVLR